MSLVKLGKNYRTPESDKNNNWIIDGPYNTTNQQDTHPHKDQLLQRGTNENKWHNVVHF